MKKQLTILLAALMTAGILTACRRDTRPKVTAETTVPLATVHPTVPTTVPTVPAARPVPETSAPTGETVSPSATIEDGNGLLPSQTKGF